MNPLPQDSENRGWFNRFKDQFFGGDEDDIVEPYHAQTAQTGATASASAAASARSARNLSVHVSRASRVAVRLNLQVIEDSKLAVDGLRNGEHQIINLEKAKPEMRERILDFLMGACYALDGKVNRIGDKVYMFVPANVDVDTGEVETTQFRRSPYEDDSSL